MHSLGGTTIETGPLKHCILLDRQWQTLSKTIPTKYHSGISCSKISCLFIYFIFERFICRVALHVSKVMMRILQWLKIKSDTVAYSGHQPHPYPIPTKIFPSAPHFHQLWPHPHPIPIGCNPIATPSPRNSSPSPLNQLCSVLLLTNSRPIGLPYIHLHT